MRRFVILSPPRAASTSLRLALDERPEVMCHGEAFGVRAVQRLSRRVDPDLHPPEALLAMRSERPAAFSGLLWPAGGPPWQGVKVLVGQAVYAGNAGFLRDLVERDADVILLWRRDLLARWRSEFLLRYDRGLRDGRHVAALRPARVRDECEELLATARRAARTLLRRPAQRALALDFDDLVGGGGALDRLSAFLGLAGPPLRLPHERGAWATRDRGPLAPLDAVLADPALAALADVPPPYDAPAP